VATPSHGGPPNPPTAAVRRGPSLALHRARYGSPPALHSCPSPALHRALSDQTPGYACAAARRSRPAAAQNDREKDKSEIFSLPRSANNPEGLIFNDVHQCP